MRVTRRLIPFVAAALFLAICVGTVAAATVTWTKADMVAAVRALGYPKPHARKVTCKAVGPAFRCNATYRRKRVFYAQGQGPGGWLCAGAKLSACKTLPRGFLAKDAIPAGLTLDAMVSTSAVGYIQDKYGIASGSTQRSQGCTPAGTNTWTCPFTYPSATITITYKTARGGWIVIGSG